MTLIEALRFDSTINDPELCEIDLADVLKFLAEEAPGPAVYVLEERELAALLVAATATNKTLIADRGDQNVTASDKEIQTTPLAQAFASAKSHAALRVHYRYAGKLNGGVRAFLGQLENAKRPRAFFFFLGTSSAIWQQLVRRVAKRTPEERDLRQLRRMYFGRSRAAETVRRRILMAAGAPLGAVIVLQGESGTGKEIVAKAIHQFSGRKGPFRAVNCAAIPESMAVDALFGHEDGTFTGVLGQSEGYFEQASGGTLFLDEIGELPRETQAMLLRAVQERVIYRIGGKHPVRIDVKIVAATHRSLHAMVARDRFRGDLIHRLGGFWIVTPTLREHSEDIELHVRRIWCESYQRPPLPEAIMRILRSWDWPGNVRQLENVLLTLSLEAGFRKVTRELLMNVLAQQRFGVVPHVDGGFPRSTKVAAEALQQHVQSYREARPRYVLLEQTLRTIVERIVKNDAPLTIVRSHTLTLARFAERVQRANRDASDDPLESWRDLCRVRAIVYTQEEKQGLYAELSKYLELADAGHSPPGDFDLSSSGFRPLEYYARVREGVTEDLARVLDVEVPIEAVGLWGRVRLRTILEEVTLAVRDEAVPSGAPLPEWWGAKLVGLAGVLGNVQLSLGRIYSSVRTWAGSYGAYLTEEDARQELAILETALVCVPEDATMAARAGKLAMILGDWDRAIRILEPHIHSKYEPVLRDLGVALCKKYASGSVSHQKGLSLLEEACQLAPRDLDAFASFAGALKRAGHIERARDYYQKAVAIDGADPYALGGYLETSLMLDRETDFIANLTPAMERAILRCRDRVAASVDLPWAYFDLGKYLMLLGETHEGLAAYAKGIGCSNAPFMIETTLRSVEALVEFACVPAELEIARRMLAVGWCARFPSDEARARLAAATPMRTNVPGPVVMLVEAGEEPSAGHAATLRTILNEGLRGFRGTVVTVGADGWGRRLVPESIHYAPANTKSYPTLHAWADVVASGIRPSDIVVLMLGDDHRTAADRRLALELGARVGMLPTEEDQEGEPAASEESAEIVAVRDGKALASLLSKKG